MRRSSRRREAACPTRRGAARKQVFTATVSSALLLFFVYKVRFEPEIIRSNTRDRTRTRKTGREAEPPSPFKSSWENRGGGGFREKGRRRGNGDDDEEDEEGRGGGSGLAHRRRGPCAPRSGLVSSGLLGTLGDNLFEMGFANRASVELCWDVSYTNSWRSKVFLDRGRRCFPNSFLPPLGGRDGRGNLGGPEDRGSDRYLELGDLPPELRRALRIDEGGQASSASSPENLLDEKDLERRSVLLPCRHLECDFTRKGTEALLDAARKGGDSDGDGGGYRALRTNAFFLHHGWIEGWESEVRDWLAVHDSCCPSPPPPDDAVVVHIELSVVDGLDASIGTGFYRDLFERYGLTDRPIWAVHDRERVDGTDALLEKMIEDFPTAVIKRGRDEYDTFW